MHYELTLSKEQLNKLLSFLDTQLKVNGLESLHDVGDIYNALMRANPIETTLVPKEKGQDIKIDEEPNENSENNEREPEHESGPGGTGGGLDVQPGPEQ